MSPKLLDITKLAPEERDVNIVTEAEALRALVFVFISLNW